MSATITSPSKYKYSNYRSELALDLENLIPHRFNKILWRISSYGDRSGLRNAGLSMREWRVLAHLGAFGRQSIREITEKSGIEQSVTSRTIKNLAAKGLVNTQKSESDSRVTLAQLTPKGIQVHDRISPARAIALGSIQSALTDKELKTLFRLCDKLENRLDELNTETQVG